MHRAFRKAPLEDYSLTLCSIGGAAVIDGNQSYVALKIDNVGSSFYNAHVTIKGLGADGFSWTAALFIDLALRDLGTTTSETPICSADVCEVSPGVQDR